MPRHAAWSALAGLVLVTAVQAQTGDAPALIIIDPSLMAPEIGFDAPLEIGDPIVDGLSLSALAQGQPLFPPVEGLPPEVWQDRQCAGCHNWDRETLCAQGQFYLGASGQENLVKAHPFGGGFKRALRRWAAQGCK